MEEEKYYTEIEHIIKRQEVNKRARVIEENYETLSNYWNIGRILIEVQGGSERAKYGEEIIKKWSFRFTKDYGKGYDITNLRKFRQFYIMFPKGVTLSRVSWSHIVVLLPIKDKNKRNYYINLCQKHSLSVRELRNEIKNNSYERLLDKPKNIEIEQPKNKLSITTDMKNPIIINLKENETIECEKDLEMKLLSELNLFFKQLGVGFTLAGNQYKIVKDNQEFYLDMLLFNTKLNCYFVVELKVRELQKEDKGQIEFYMKLVDEEVKEPFHNKTIGIIITKKQDKYIASFIRSDTLIPLTYKLNEGNE